MAGNGKLKVRLARPWDLKELMPLYKKTFISDTPYLYDDSIPKVGLVYLLIAGIVKRLGIDPYRMYVGLLDENLVGSCSFSRLGKFWRTNFIIVNPHYRGKGYGKRIYRSAIDDVFSSSKRIMGVISYLREDNVPSKRLHNELGFVKFTKLSFMLGDMQSIGFESDGGAKQLTPCKESLKDLSREYTGTFSHNADPIEKEARLSMLHIPIDEKIYYRSIISFSFRTGSDWKGGYILKLPKGNEVGECLILLPSGNGETCGNEIAHSILTHLIAECTKRNITNVVIKFDANFTDVIKLAEEIGFKEIYTMEGFILKKVGSPIALSR